MVPVVGRGGVITTNVSISHFDLVAVIAQGIVDLDAVDHVEAFTMPYPRTVQLGLDRLGLQCLLAGHAGPTGIPDLVRWAWSRQLSEWPLQLDSEFVSSGDLLVDPLSRRPTKLCAAWAWEYSDDAPFEHARDFLRTLVERGTPAVLTKAIQHLIDTPVIVTKQKATMAAKPGIGGLWHVMTDFYRRAPEWYFRGDRAATCARCGELAIPVGKADWWCPWDARPGDTTTTGEELDRDQGVWQLDGALTSYFAVSGRRAGAIRDRLAEAQVTEVRLSLEEGPWLEVTVPSGETWCVRVDDRYQPGLTALAARRTTAQSGARYPVLAVPDAWAQDARLGTLRHLIGSDMAVLTDSELIKTATGKAGTDA